MDKMNFSFNWEFNMDSQNWEILLVSPLYKTAKAFEIRGDKISVEALQTLKDNLENYIG